ncbi:hypothetical protein BX666DRAFT_1854216 [Dichotomocladium elegans]|nr:hypothetical protein BX666DRAFT_1854216 [Dichotomocladium elegans]
MFKPLRALLSESTKYSYFHVAFATTAKLSLAAVQLDRLVSRHTLTDISTSLEEASAHLDVVISITEQSRSQIEHSDQALLSMYKAIVKFRQSCNHFFGFMERKTKKLRDQIPVRHRSPSHERSLNIAIQESRANIPYMITVLQNCKEILPTILQIIKKKSWKGKQNQGLSPNDVMMAYVDTMVLMARLKFQVEDEETWFTAFEDLSTGQQACEELGYSSGYRWLSGAFYMFGAALANARFYADAIYPLRKSCTMLEKSLPYVTTEAGRLQLAKRYEILGSCCKKDSRFEESITAHRSALKKIPKSSIVAFVKKADQLGLYSLIEQNPLIPKLIDRYLRAALFDGNPKMLTFASDVMQLHDLTQEQKCIIFECELRTLSLYSFQVDCRIHQATIIEKLMQYYTPSLYPLRRAR